MNRSTPFRRSSKRLKRSEMPRRKKPMPRVSAKRAAALRTPAGGVPPVPRPRVHPAVPPAKRRTLAERSGGWCEIRLDGCWGRATDPHHRVTRKGPRTEAERQRLDRLSSLLHGCRFCHGEVHRLVGESLRWHKGWLVKECFAPGVCIARGPARPTT